MMLPPPSASRFQPLRSGLINLFKYQNQEFWYEKGRLLIRGNNGTGKSRVLALQLPFLLDGEISPRRVEPDGDPARQIAWHLLMDEHEQRTGYTWLELGRRDETGEEHFVTLGCGMRAIKGGDNQPTRWFFITDQRVGRDFSLMDGPRPLTADRLEETLGEACIFKKAADYRAAIDRRLFGLGQDRYAALIELLIRLRAPQLAKKLDERTLFAALSDALPPLASEVVGPVAAAFKQLEELRGQFESLQSLVEALAAFQSSYQIYLQVALLRLAAQVRSTHARYEEAQRKLLDLERSITAAEADGDAARQAVGEATNALTAATARHDALRESPAADAAQRLDDAKRLADDDAGRASEAQRRADGTEAQLADVEAEQAQQSTECEQSLVRRDAAWREAAKRAGAAGFARDLTELLPGEAAWQPVVTAFEKLRLSHDERARDHLHRLDQIDADLGAVAEANAKLSRAQGDETRLADEAGAHRASIDQHDGAARQALARLAMDYAAWQRELRWLRAPAWSEFGASFDEWLETGDEEQSVLAPVLEKAVGDERDALAAAKERLKTQRTIAAEERQKLLGERASLGSAPPPPAAPATRDQAARDGRPGAPLWALCEFHPDLTLPQRAGLEAAMEAAGLLDAWLTPDGTLSSDDLPCDTFLGVGEPVSGPTLGDWLIPDEGGEPRVADGTLRTALAKIGAGDGATAHWVALDGRWRLGPAWGRGGKPEPQHLGATSREAARQRRLGQIATELAVLDKRGTVLDAEANALKNREIEANVERQRAPKDREIARHLTLRTDARMRLNRTLSAAAEAAQKARRAREAATSRTEKLRKDAHDLGYGAFLENLASLRPAWSSYKSAAAELWSEARAWVVAAVQLERLAGRWRTSAESNVQEAERARVAQSAALRSGEIFRELQQTLGASVAEFQQRLQERRKEQATAQTALNTASAKVIEVDNRLANFSGALPSAQEKVGEVNTVREGAIKALRVPLGYGLFPEAHPDLARIEQNDWSSTRAYAIARQMARDLPGFDLADSAWTARVNTLGAQINDLRTRTGAACEIESQMLSGELTVVTCRYQGARLAPAQCLAAVVGERETHERLLGAREREIIDRHLINEVSLQLQTLIEDARLRTEAMNGEMTRCTTTLGITLRLAWAPVTEGLPPGLPAVRRLLLADHASWTPEERTTVGRFLHELIRTEQAKNPTATTAEQLLNALDYRQWHAFFAERHQGGRWERLTKKRYGTGSVGEKALMLTIPQMAAAASHYKSAASHAPRFILLDEAFSGIDKPTRARCMGLLESFDLDLVMTSEREWGAHSTISGIAIYQLVADAEAVAATRWVWNGSKTVLAPVPDTPELIVNL